jgi:hypothetical protein
MCTSKWDPKKRNEVKARLLQLGDTPFEGANVLGKWNSLNGDKAFTLFEVVDPKVIEKAYLPWKDLIEVKQIPVMEDEEALKFIKEKKLTEDKQEEKRAQHYKKIYDLQKQMDDEKKKLQALK